MYMFHKRACELYHILVLTSVAEAAHSLLGFCVVDTPWTVLWLKDEREYTRTRSPRSGNTVCPRPIALRLRLLLSEDAYGQGTCGRRECCAASYQITISTSMHPFSSNLKLRPSGARPFVSRCSVSRSPHARSLRLRCRAEAAKGPVVVIDNYDSFTYNLCQYLGDLGCEFVVYKNDEKTVEEIKAMQPRGVLISPGPGCPPESGISLEATRELGPLFPLFGVCMGHQCIGEAFGGDVIRTPTGLMHGKTSPVFHNNVGVLEGMENPFEACRYHSLVIKKETLPEDLEITAWTEDGTIMGVRSKKYPHIQGVQFHPESIITQNGKLIVGNWVKSLEE
eukprot:gene27092-2317_t